MIDEKYTFPNTVNLKKANDKKLENFQYNILYYYLNIKKLINDYRN